MEAHEAPIEETLNQNLVISHGDDDAPIEETLNQNVVISHGDEEESDASSCYLPREILLEILTRLPFDCLLRFQTVSKSWNAMISELRFSRVHHHRNSHYQLLWQSYMSLQRRDELLMDCPAIDHSDWKALLPPDKHEVVWKSASMGFSIEQRTGKNCFMLGSECLEMSLRISESKRRWKMKHHPQSRFSQVAELVKWSKTLFIRGVVKVEMLSPDTFYAAYLVFILPKKYEPANIFIGKSSRCEDRKGLYPVDRGDGWMELEIGELCATTSKDENRDIEAVVLLQARHYKMCGLIVEGIEFRPSGYQLTSTLLKKD